jgi:predicted transcriptional regulator
MLLFERFEVLKNSAKRDRILTQADAILPMREPYMQQIVNGEKNYEFRKYCLKECVKRIWFYSTAPQSSIEYVCEILPARTRDSYHSVLEEDGLGNKEFNARHKDWDGYDFAYKILSVYKIEKPVTLKDLREQHGMRSAPRGLVYAPLSLINLVDWQKQSKVR